MPAATSYPDRWRQTCSNGCTTAAWLSGYSQLTIVSNYYSFTELASFFSSLRRATFSANWAASWQGVRHSSSIFAWISRQASYHRVDQASWPHSPCLASRSLARWRRCSRRWIADSGHLTTWRYLTLDHDWQFQPQAGKSRTFLCFCSSVQVNAMRLRTVPHARICSAWDLRQKMASPNSIGSYPWLASSAAHRVVTFSGCHVRQGLTIY